MPETVVAGGSGQVIETKPMAVASTVAVNSAAASELRDDVEAQRAAQEAERLRLEQEEAARAEAAKAEEKR